MNQKCFSSLISCPATPWFDEVNPWKPCCSNLTGNAVVSEWHVALRGGNWEGEIMPPSDQSFQLMEKKKENLPISELSMVSNHCFCLLWSLFAWHVCLHDKMWTFWLKSYMSHPDFFLNRGIITLDLLNSDCYTCLAKTKKI